MDCLQNLRLKNVCKQLHDSIHSLSIMGTCVAAKTTDSHEAAGPSNEEDSLSALDVSPDDTYQLNAPRKELVRGIGRDGINYGRNGRPVVDSLMTGSAEWRKFHGTILRSKLRQWMDSQDTSTETDTTDFLVIDVRDPSLDYPGGHIKGCINIEQEIFKKNIPLLIQKYHETPNIIIHCMYSQCRGPLCCRSYCVGVESLLHEFHDKEYTSDLFDNSIENEDWKGLKDVTMDQQMATNLTQQNVFLLKEGFRGWVNEFKDDTRYVEDFDMEHWVCEEVGGTTGLYHKNDW